MSTVVVGVPTEPVAGVPSGSGINPALSVAPSAADAVTSCFFDVVSAIFVLSHSGIVSSSIMPPSSTSSKSSSGFSLDQGMYDTPNSTSQ